MLSGLILCVIGLAGVSGMNQDALYDVSRLFQPTGWGLTFDQIYWTALAAVGLWLLSRHRTRLAAGSALFLVCTKIVILRL